jgi:hypothetical protein
MNINNTSIIRKLILTGFITGSLNAGDLVIQCINGELVSAKYDNTTLMSYNIISNSCNETINIENSLQYSSIDTSKYLDTSVTLNSGTHSNGVYFISPYDESIKFKFQHKEFSIQTPAKVLFFRLGNKVMKVDFPTELLGDTFEVIDRGNSYFGYFKENISFSAPTIIY